MLTRVPVALAFFALLLSAVPSFAVEPAGLTPPPDVRAILTKHCADCHGADLSEADVRLDQWAATDDAARIALLNRVQDQVFFGTMPPAEADPLSEADRERLSGWVRDTLRSRDASELDKKLTYPDYGNYVDHESLFDGSISDAPFTPARRWLVSPQIFHQRVMDVFGLEGRDRQTFLTRNFYGVTNPFVLPDRAGVRDYDISTLDGGHLLVMLTNAKWIANKQLTAALIEKGVLDPKNLPDKRDNWYPRQIPEEFRTIVLKDEPATDAEIAAAIRVQFERALRREPSGEELAKYAALTRSAVDLAGNVAGLQQMLTTVLLESEFLYRLEFGAGQPDEHGRRMLSPHDLAHAISYSLGDRGPDAKLLTAAREGRLKTSTDVEREVRRLLADGEYYRGPIDPTLGGKHYRSQETSHPKLVRFFREFFGYPGSLKVFKDVPRSGGKYQPPSRGTQGTPGWLTLEADRIVLEHVEADRDVFRTLLTFDEFYVYHNMSNEEGEALLAEWQEVYDRLKETNWKTDAEIVFRDNLDYLLSKKQALRIEDNDRGVPELKRLMLFFEETFGQGRRPFTRVPWSHGYYYQHSIFYSLPKTPGAFRYGRQNGKNVQPPKGDSNFWDYEPVQPFPIAQRKGILTHPAWLIAFSSNFHTDPIRRGRWIREKLLAGRVPDVPITVDAQVPEDPHKTFRERVEVVTESAECIKCHQHMNPLGMAFEMYDDFGRYRTEELLEHPENLISKGNGKTTFDEYPTKPVVTTGRLDGTGDPHLDGDVTDALDLIDRLARSDRVRQSIIRHAFRYFLGRNELPSDSQTLIAADRAYLESGGSFRAVVISLLTSDSFLYRKDLSRVSAE